MDMLLAVVTYFFAASLAVIASFFCASRAERWGLIDIPNGRKMHARSTPLIGGLIIWAGLCSLLLIKPSVDLIPYCIPLATLTVIVGVMDDLHDISARLRLVVHLSIGLGMALWAGIKLETLGELLPGIPMTLGPLALPVTCFSVATAMNAVNMMDGIDGLAGALSLIPVLVVGSLAAQAGNEDLTLTAIALAGGLSVFLLLNFPFPWRQQASCFLGDTGSTLLGLMVGWLLIGGGSNGLFSPVLALYLLALPLIDTAGVMVRRVLRGVSMTTPGRDHFHHVLIDSGMQHKHVVYMLIALAVAIASLGLIMEKRATPEWVMLAVFISILTLNLVALRSADKAKTILRDKLFIRQL